MAADLYIHILEGITEEEVKIFFCNDSGSKYFDLDKVELKHKIFNHQINNKFSDTLRVYVGSDSSIENGLVSLIENFIGEDFPVINDSLIFGVLHILSLSSKLPYYRLNEKDEILIFLNKHKGKKIFCVNW